MPVTAPSLLTELRRAVRTLHYSPRTGDAYAYWVRRFVCFSGMRHPRELGPSDVSRFLSHLAVEGKVTAGTQNQALAAIVFLYKDVLNMPVGWLQGLVRAKRSARVPVVLTKQEVRRVLGELKGRSTVALVAALLYGTGMRLLEGLRVRVKDIDFAKNEIVVRGGKGDRDRVTMLPDRLKGPLLKHLAAVRTQHEGDVAKGGGWVELPGALEAKYPNAGREWATRIQGSGTGGAYREACELSHVTTFVCYPPARSRLRHSHCAGAPRPPQPEYDHDVHARPQSWGPGCAQSGGHAVILRLD